MESIPWYYHEVTEFLDRLYLLYHGSPSNIFLLRRYCQRLRNNMPSYAQLIQAFSPLNIRTDELDAYISEIKKSANEWLERLDGRVKVRVD